MVKVEELCRACLCETTRHFYLKADDELRSYEMVTGIELPDEPKFSIHLCFRCYKLYDRIISFRQCCYIAEKYFSKCANKTDEVDKSSKEKMKVAHVLHRDMQYELSQATTLCFDSIHQGFAGRDKKIINTDVLTESGNWKYLSCGGNASVYFHQRHYDVVCDELDEESDYFYESDELETFDASESEISENDEKFVMVDVEISENNKINGVKVKLRKETHAGVTEDITDGMKTFNVTVREISNNKDAVNGVDITENNKENGDKYKQKKINQNIQAKEKKKAKVKLRKETQADVTEDIADEIETSDVTVREICDNKEGFAVNGVEITENKVKKSEKNGVKYKPRKKKQNVQAEEKKKTQNSEVNELASKWITEQKLSVQQVLEAMAAYRCSEEFVSARHKCEPCAKVFSYELQAMEHKTRHIEPWDLYRCEMCRQCFRTWSTLSMHRLKSHTRSFHCKVCDKVFGCRTIALNHILRMHARQCLNLTQDEKFICEVCGQITKNRVEMRCHQRVHDDTRNFKCDMCPKVFGRKSRFKAHIVSHMSVRLHSCAKCDASFMARSSLLDHGRKHDNYVGFRCEPCGRTYRNISKYNLHMKIGARHLRPEDKKFVCTLCGRRFLREDNLDQHVARVHLKQHTKNFVCHECGDAFALRASLERHLSNHEDVAPRSCPLCGQSFLHLAPLRAHLNTQHCSEELKNIDLSAFENQFDDRNKCSQCDKQFKSKPALRTHYNRVRCRDCRLCFPATRDLKQHRLTFHTTMPPAENMPVSALNISDQAIQSEMKVQVIRELAYP